MARRSVRGAHLQRTPCHLQRVMHLLPRHLLDDHHLRRRRDRHQHRPRLGAGRSTPLRYPERPVELPPLALQLRRGHGGGDAGGHVLRCRRSVRVSRQRRGMARRSGLGRTRLLDRHPPPAVLSYTGNTGVDSQAIATCDLDCDGVTVDITMSCTEVGAADSSIIPSCSWIFPARAD